MDQYRPAYHVIRVAEEQRRGTERPKAYERRKRIDDRKAGGDGRRSLRRREIETG